jgi:hypothetical protein
MALDRFLLYRNESLSEIIVSYNKDGAGGSLDPVLKAAIVTLNGDLVNFRKLFAGSTPVDKLAPASPVCAACDRFKKQYEEARSENTTKAKRIVSLEKANCQARGPPLWQRRRISAQPQPWWIEPWWLQPW